MGKPRLTLMVGLPASGKSTYAHKIAPHLKAVVLSSDTIRNELLGSEKDQSNNELVFKTLYSRAKELLIKGINVIIDATNINMKDRKRTLSNFSNLNIERYCVVMVTPIETCIELDKSRERTVGEEVIKKFLYRFEYPMDYEGFDKIHAESIFNTIMHEQFEKMKNFNQKNPHHKFTLDKHCIECCKHLSKKTNDTDLIEAGLVHDIGK